MLDNRGNFAREGVSSAIASGDTTIGVNSASAFPDPSVANYNVTVYDAGSYASAYEDPDVEIVRVTGRDTTNDVLTVTRGQEGTTAVSHPSSAAVLLAPTAKMFDDIETELGDALQTGENFDGQGTSDLQNLNLVETREATATNETVVRATRSSGTGSVASGTFVNIYDGASKDNRGEYNSSAQFQPDKSGEYQIIASADVRGNTSAGDELFARVQDVDSGSLVVPVDGQQATGAVSNPTFVFSVDLNAGVSYEVQMANNDSSFSIRATGNTTGVIKRSVVQ